MSGRRKSARHPLIGRCLDLRVCFAKWPFRNLLPNMSPPHPLSDPQREVWRLQRLLPGRRLWNIGGVIHIEGDWIVSASRQRRVKSWTARKRFGCDW